MLNKKSVDDINVKGQRVLVRCDFNVPLKDGKITAAQKEWARSYALKDAEGFKKFLELAGPAVPMGEIGLKDAPEGEKLDADTIAILKNLGISEEDVKKYGNKEVTL